MRQEINSIRYEIKLKLQKIDKGSLGIRCEINSIRKEINDFRYEIKRKAMKIYKSIGNRCEINSFRYEVKWKSIRNQMETTED